MILPRRTRPPSRTISIVQEAEHLAAQLYAEARRFAALNNKYPLQARPAGRDDRAFWQFRPYQYGDPPRNIDWRKTAAGHDVMIRERQRHDDVTLSVWLDPSLGMQFKSVFDAPTKFERGLTMLLTLTRVFARQDMQVTPVLWSHTRTSATLPHLADLFLGGATPALDDLTTRPLPRGPVLLLSDFWGDVTATLKTADYLRAGGHAVTLIQITDPAEQTLPFHGRIQFVHGEDVEKIEFVDDIRSTYQMRIAAHVNRLRAAYDAAHIGFLQHVTNTSPLVPLATFLNGVHHVGP